MKLTSGFLIEENVSLKNFTSWLVGGSADLLAQPRTPDELREVYAWGLAQKMSISLLGGGTNVLVSDQGVRGLTIALKKFSSAIVTTTEAVIPNGAGGPRLEIDALSGTSKSELLKIFLKYKLEPALFLAGLPGDVGGGIAMNAGVSEMMKPREFVEMTDWVEVLKPDGGVARYTRSELKWSYRHCSGWAPGIIMRVGFSWPLEPSGDILDRVRAANKVRLAKQPLDLPSCGSVFINPEGHKSGQLVESAGLKGFTIGGAQVSMKHANFIVNTGTATADDIHAVISHVQATVLARSAVSLKTEVVYLGEWP